MDDVWATVADQRGQLAAALSVLTADQWQVDSLCSGWTAHDVLAHLVWLAELDRPRMVAETTVASVHHRCSPLGAMVPIARSLARRSAPGELLDRLDAARGGRFVVPGAPPEAALAEVLVHGLDITRPLDMPDVVDPDRVRRAIVGVRRFGPVYRTAPEVRRIRLTSTSDWSLPGSGGGELVAGDGDLMLLVAGRLRPSDLATA